MKLVQLVLLFILLQTLPAHQGAQNRIQNGFDAYPPETEYVVKLEIVTWNGASPHVFSCTGALISNRHVLTAAHCLDNETIQVEVYQGFTQHDLKLIGSCHNCWTLHATDDIAVMTINKYDCPVYGEPIRLPSWSDADSDLIGRTALVHGWGLTESGWTDTLRSVEITLSSMNCKSEMFRDAHFFCADVINGQRTDVGDSGGPVIIDGKIFGVTSFGYDYNITDECGRYIGREINRTAFTKVIDNLDWISKQTGLYIEP